MYGAIGAIIGQVLAGIAISISIFGVMYREKIKDVYHKYIKKKDK